MRLAVAGRSRPTRPTPSTSRISRCANRWQRLDASKAWPQALATFPPYPPSVCAGGLACAFTSALPCDRWRTGCCGMSCGRSMSGSRRRSTSSTRCLALYVPSSLLWLQMRVLWLQMRVCEATIEQPCEKTTAGHILTQRARAAAVAMRLARPPYMGWGMQSLSL